MKSVGIRELKSRLSHYVRLVRDGEEVLVTDRGEVVAALCPPHLSPLAPDLSPGMAVLARRGLVELRRSHTSDVYPPFEAIGDEGLATRLLDDERGAS